MKTTFEEQDEFMGICTNLTEKGIAFNFEDRDRGWLPGPLSFCEDYTRYRLSSVQPSNWQDICLKIQKDVIFEIYDMIRCGWVSDNIHLLQFSEKPELYRIKEKRNRFISIENRILKKIKELDTKKFQSKSQSVFKP